MEEWHSLARFLSVKSDPARDLTYVLTQYKGDSTWSVMEEGYWYQRSDGAIRLWCSAVPVIGVAYVKFLEAEAAYKRANSLDQIESLSDVTWAANDTVLELQRQFVEERNGRLVDFSRRSDKIALSPDGKDVFIVRNHHAYDVADGFMELNEPPEAGNGYSTQVINCFSWSDGGSCWSKITLPRDAHVDQICFEGECCHLHIRQITTGRVVQFFGPASAIRGLAWIGMSARPHHDAQLWQELKEAIGNNTEGD
jgi:hypothetical protein